MRPSSTLLITAVLGALVIMLLAVNLPFGAPLPKRTILYVPYVSQVFGGQWIAPWDEACEEATLLMVEAYYKDALSLSPKTARERMNAMFAWEDETFKTNTDTDAEQTIELIKKQTSFRASILRNPTVDDIKRELVKQRPVIAFINMYALYQEPDLGDSLHVLVITGYDDRVQAFHVNDPARKKTLYRYDVLLHALHDFNPQTGEADGPPTVLLTERADRWPF